MGLDFTLYKKLKTEKCADAYRVADFENERELAYGRKSWELVYELVPNYNDDEDPIVDKEVWDALMAKMEPIGNKLLDIIDAFNREENQPADYPEFIFNDKHKKLIAEYEYWYNKTFDTSPTLGYQFSAYYMNTFWEANDEIQKVYADPEWEVRACVSY